MTQPGYQEGSEPMWWWKVAQHLDEAQLALTNAMAHNLDDQRPAFALQDRLREGQAILLEIFRAKGLLPGSTNGRIEPPMPGVPMPGVPASVVLPFPPGVPPGVPVAAVLPFPPLTGGEAATAVPTTDVEQRPPLAAEEPAVPEAHQDAASSETKPPAAAPPAAAPAVVAPAVPAAITPEAPSADPGAGGAGG